MDVALTAGSERATLRLECWTAALRRLGTFEETEKGSVAWEATVELETAAEQAVAEPVRVSEDFMALCMGLLEEQLPVSSRATKAVLMLLANLCLTDENRLLARDFGLPGTCVLLLQRHKELSAETLYYVFDLMSTMTASDGGARQNMRPAIPYVLAAMQDHSTALDVLFGATFLLHALAMLDAVNCEVIVERDGLQVLVNVFRKADQILQKTTRGQRRSSGGGSVQRPASTTGTPVASLIGTLQAQKQAERVQLCDGVARWSRDALMTVCRSTSIEASTKLQKRLAAVDFGPFGASIAVDDLKWSLLTEQKKRHSGAAAAPS